MKTDIHPNFEEITATCICGAEFALASTEKAIRVEICSNCHPFYAGTDKIVDVAGRIDKFKNKYSRKGKKKDEAAA